MEFVRVAGESAVVLASGIGKETHGGGGGGGLPISIADKRRGRGSQTAEGNPVASGCRVNALETKITVKKYPEYCSSCNAHGDCCCCFFIYFLKFAVANTLSQLTAVHHVAHVTPFLSATVQLE